MTQCYLLWLGAYLPWWHLGGETQQLGGPKRFLRIKTWIQLWLSTVCRSQSDFEVAAPETFCLLSYVSRRFSNQATLLCEVNPWWGYVFHYPTAQWDVSLLTRSVVWCEWRRSRLTELCSVKSDICIFFLLCWHLTTWPFPFLHGSLFNQFQASSLHENFYLQGCVFSVFALLCLIDSNMGFLNGLSSDLFPQEPMTQNDFKDAWWECRSLWS